MTLTMRTLGSSDVAVTTLSFGGGPRGVTDTANVF